MCNLPCRLFRQSLGEIYQWVIKAEPNVKPDGTAYSAMDLREIGVDCKAAITACKRRLRRSTVSVALIKPMWLP